MYEVLRALLLYLCIRIENMNIPLRKWYGNIIVSECLEYFIAEFTFYLLYGKNIIGPEHQ